MDGLIVLFLRLTGLFEYINYGPFGFLGIPFFPLIAWTSYFLLYFYFLPSNKQWMYFYVLVASLFSLMFSNVLENLGIIIWHHGRILIPFITYFVWHCFSTWAFLKLSKPIKKSDLSTLFAEGRLILYCNVLFPHRK